MSRPPRHQEEDVAVALLSNTSRMTSILCLKLADLLIHLYILAIATYTLAIAVIIMHQVPSKESSSFPSNSSMEKNSTNATWWQTELTVLGKAKWTMSYNHFILLFAIFHIVYGIIATVCDLMFFHALFKRIVRLRYISTVLPVHRLFFVVMCWIDIVMFVTSSNITGLIDIWALLLIFLLGVLVTIDTAIILMSLKAVHGKSAPIFSTPWRNGSMVVLLFLTGLYTLVSQYLDKYTWEAGPSLILTLISAILLLVSLFYNLKVSIEGEGLDRMVNFFLCVSGTNVLNLFSVGAVAHRLLARTEFDSF